MRTQLYPIPSTNLYKFHKISAQIPERYNKDKPTNFSIFIFLIKVLIKLNYRMGAVVPTTILFFT
jgi:hypothetical protein